jgi:hypothetical protein
MSPTGILTHIFEHATQDHHNQFLSPRLWGVFKGFKIADQHGDLYGYRNYPGLNRWAWDSGALSESRVIPLDSDALSALRPVTLLEVPIIVGKQVKPGTLWVTKPLHRVSLLLGVQLRH